MNPFLIVVFFFAKFALLSHSSNPQTPNDTASLTNFRLQTDTHGTLISNWTGPDACSGGWTGVKCSPAGRVISLSLPSLSLRGPLDRLANLDQLRRLNLSGNRLNGTVSPISSCANLKLLYLAGNDLSGEIPPEIGRLRRILRLDVSDNNIGGEIPAEIFRLGRIVTLRLENNVLTGEVPDLGRRAETLRELNLTNNELYGRVSDSMLTRFGAASFAGNEGLCGSRPLPECSLAAAGGSRTVPSSPSSPAVRGEGRRSSGMSGGAIAAVVIGNCVAVVVIASCVVAHCCGGDRRGSGGGGSTTGSENGGKRGRRRSGSGYGSGDHKKVYADGGHGADTDGTTGTDRSRLVFFDRKKAFELEDLLRASAEMLGKGSLGTVYRAVVDEGCMVAVKRLKDANPCPRREFEQYMDVIGKLRHPNVVRLRAYYYAKEEKLLVYDYLANGSLHQLLHGNRGPGRIPLDWTTRISLVLGAARGLARIHEVYGESKIPHGNIKSTNVLLDKNGLACISDFGLSLLLNPVHAIAQLGGYQAPEQAEVKRLSQMADVYSFGIVLLEVLTGRAPSQYPSPTRPPKPDEDDEMAAMDLPNWVRSVVREEWTGEVFDQELLRYKNIEEELVSMLHVGLACVVPQPEKRPTMAEVTKMIEDIRVEKSPLGEEDYDESRNSLSPSLGTTEDGMP